LLDYAQLHFAVEESLMRLFDYPDYQTHKKEHDEFLVDMQTLRAHIINDPETPADDFLMLLTQSVTTHVVQSDTHCGQHFNAFNRAA
jgi:hemerythrin